MSGTRDIFRYETELRKGSGGEHQMQTANAPHPATQFCQGGQALQPVMRSGALNSSFCFSCSPEPKWTTFLSSLIMGVSRHKINKAGSLPSSAQQGELVSPTGSIKAKDKRHIADNTTLSSQNLWHRPAVFHLR